MSDNQKKTLTSYLIGVNVLQVVLSLVIVLLKSMNMYSGYLTKGVFFIIMVILWLLAGILASLGTNMLKISRAFIYSLLAIVPIVIIVGVSFVIGLLTPEGANGWAAFFFIGGAVNFFLRTGNVLSLFLNSAYLIYASTIGVMFLSSLFGCIIALNVNLKRSRSRRRSSANKADIIDKPTDKPKDKNAPKKRKRKKKKKTVTSKKTDKENEDI